MRENRSATTPADEQEDDHRQGAHAEHLRERAGGRVDVEHREGERDGHHDRAGGRHRAAP